jgi:hypothetical protein
MVATLQIPLEDLQEPQWQALYVGDRPRYATAGSVRFVDARTLVCCSLLARKIYLIRFDLRGRSFEVLDRADTTYAGIATETDLCDVDGRGHVVTSNCEGAAMSLYRLVGDKICFTRDLPTDLPGNFCHGVRFCGPDVVVATALRDPRGAHFFDLKTMRRLLYIKTDRLPKDICFLPGGRAILITTEGAPLPEKSRARRVSENLLVKFDLVRGTWDLVARQTYDAGQLDSAVVRDDRLFAVDSHGGRILIIDTRTLQQVGQIGGFDFPHGVDVNYGMMAIACYGTNSIHVRPLGS